MVLQQGLGCELIEAVAAEFFSSWRSSGYGITWDFHLRAKRAFEASFFLLTIISACTE